MCTGLLKANPLLRYKLYNIAVASKIEGVKREQPEM